VYRSSCLVCPLLVLALGSIATAAEAAPLDSAALFSAVASPRAGHVETVADRHCWWQDGRRHCRSRTYRRQGSDYYERNADSLPYGTSRWWEEMLRENRAGNPGGGRN
jgi:hypothetical protein